MQARVGAVIGGVIVMVIGMVLATTVNNQAETLGAATNIASFTGARAVGDLIPLVYIAAILMAGLGLFAIGSLGFAGKGPLA